MAVKTTCIDLDNSSEINMIEMSLAQLWIYPIKSLAGISLPQASITPRGFWLDRHWMLVDALSGEFVTQRSLPQMALFQVMLENNCVTVLSRDGASVELNSDQADGRELSVKIWNESFIAEAVSQQLDQWFSQRLGKAVILVRMPEQMQRQVDPEYANIGEHTGFADGFPFLLLGTESVDELNRRLPQGEVMTMQRFRPNLVIKTSKAHVEDSWKRIQIGEISMRLVKPCSRCVITTINPQTAEKTAEPLKTLAGYRKQGNKVMFGQNVLHDSLGTLYIGDPVQVLE